MRDHRSPGRRGGRPIHDDDRYTIGSQAQQHQILEVANQLRRVETSVCATGHKPSSANRRPHPSASHATIHPFSTPAEAAPPSVSRASDREPNRRPSRVPSAIGDAVQTGQRRQMRTRKKRTHLVRDAKPLVNQPAHIRQIVRDRPAVSPMKPSPRKSPSFRVAISSASEPSSLMPDSAKRRPYRRPSHPRCRRSSSRCCRSRSHTEGAADFADEKGDFELDESVPEGEEQMDRRLTGRQLRSRSAGLLGYSLLARPNGGGEPPSFVRRSCSAGLFAGAVYSSLYPPPACRP